MGRNREAREEGFIDAALQEGQLNVEREDSYSFQSDRDSSILEVQNMRTNREAKKEDPDETGLQEEPPNVREDSYSFGKVIDTVITWERIERPKRGISSTVLYRKGN
jgi:hypothetical protein